MPPSHPVLKRIYNRFNLLYFDGALPDIPVLWEPTGDSVALSHRVYSEDGIEVERLTFDPALKGYTRIVKTYMLHEQIHVKYPTIGHGKRFKAEVDRLWKLGAYEGLL